MSQLQKKLNANIFGDTLGIEPSTPNEDIGIQKSWLIQSEVLELKAEIEALKKQNSDSIQRINSFIKAQVLTNEKLLKQDNVLNERDQNMSQTFMEQLRTLASQIASFNEQEVRLKKLTSEHLMILGKMEARLKKQEEALAERDAQINFLQSLLREMQHEIDQLQRR